MKRLVPWAAGAGIGGAVLLLLIAFSGISARPAAWHQAPRADATAPATVAGPPPTRVKIPAIGVDATLEDLHLDANGKLTAPKDFGHAGWYADGSRPGDPGPAVIAGHVDSKAGPAVFFRLRDLHAGAKIEVARGDGAPVSFTVLAVKRYPKNDFPTDEVYAPTPNAQLRIITCGGEFDQNRRSYVDNIVAYAAMA